MSTPVIKCDQQTNAERNVPIGPKVENVCISKSKSSTLSMLNIPTDPGDKITLNINITLGRETKNLINNMIRHLECSTDLREQVLSIGKIYISK